MRIFYVGNKSGNSLARYNELKKRYPNSTIFDLHDVYGYVPRLIWSVERRFRNGPVTWIMNQVLKHKVKNFKPDLVWTEMGREIYPTTIAFFKTCGAYVINTYSDNFLDKISKKISRHYNKSIPYFDIIFTPRESDYPEYKKFGAKRVEKFWKGFNTVNIYKQKLSEEEKKRYGCDVTFAGHCEGYRQEYLVEIARTGAKVKIWGSKWEDKTWPEDVGNLYIDNLPQKEYAKALNGAKIAVTFTSKWANDTQNSRLFEIPGSSTFMLSERTNDSVRCFEEGVEAEFFSSKDEMLEKAQFYLKNEEAREKIAKAGHERALKFYTLEKRVDDLLETVIEAMAKDYMGKSITASPKE